MQLKAILAILINLLFVLPSLAASPVWEVKSGDSIIYLGGTCHVLRERDLPLPAAFDRAYRQSATVVFETDIGKLESPEFQRRMMAELLYRDGRTLQDDLSPEAYLALKAYCKKAGLPITILNPMKPPLVVLTLLSIELQKLGATQSGVDHLFFARAMADGKRTEGLETAEEQLGFLAAMGRGSEDDLIEQSLADLGRTGEIFKSVIDAWKRGDEKELNRFLVESTRRDFPEIYQSLFVSRNTKWLPRIEAFFDTPEREMVLVGAGHLVGQEGLIESLEKRGYEVRQLE